MAAHPGDSVAVDIVMRTKDRPLLLARALDDVLAQSHQAWTLTIVNDGGAAAPVDALLTERAARADGRFRVIHNSESRGMEAATNQAVRSTQHPWIAVHDDDDTWAPTFLERTVAWISSHDDAPAVAVRTEIVWEQVRADGVHEISRQLFLPELEQVTLAQLVRFNACVPISVLYRRSALTEVGLFDEALEVVGDWECNLRLAARGPFGFLPERPLAFWHQRPDSAGALGNSVIDRRDEHRRADRMVRDRELRHWVSREGAGLPLYLTRYLDDRFDELHRRLDAIEQEQRARFWPRAWRAVRRVLHRGDDT
ncbi:glycosyltransferase family 2 protein [Microbacterium binotii]|uniref:Glycosyltransferase 2-like domain-containing protein n=1 Tax=Microbacterium binotii TaxID=462710 RepID=A0ABN3P650_9MICO